MNENLNLVEILKDCPEGTKLYSTVFGDVKFIYCNCCSTYPILVKDKNSGINSVTSQGKAYANLDGECVLFPSKDQRDWSKFKPKKPKFDPKTLQPFDRVLQFDTVDATWTCDFYSHKNKACDPYLYECVGAVPDRVIPYNDETKHLVGTGKEAPEYYRYWED